MCSMQFWIRKTSKDQRSNYTEAGLDGETIQMKLSNI